MSDQPTGLKLVTADRRSSGYFCPATLEGRIRKLNSISPEDAVWQAKIVGLLYCENNLSLEEIGNLWKNKPEDVSVEHLVCLSKLPPFIQHHFSCEVSEEQRLPLAEAANFIVVEGEVEQVAIAEKMLTDGVSFDEALLQVSDEIEERGDDCAEEDLGEDLEKRLLDPNDPGQVALAVLSHLVMATDLLGILRKLSPEQLDRAFDDPRNLKQLRRMLGDYDESAREINRLRKLLSRFC